MGDRSHLSRDGRGPLILTRNYRRNVAYPTTETEISSTASTAVALYARSYSTAVLGTSFADFEEFDLSRVGTKPYNAGVVGEGNRGLGVMGYSESNVGVFGHAGDIGVIGAADRRFGVLGVGKGGAGWSDASVGVYGHSHKGTGVVGSTGNTQENVLGGFAGFFWGRVGINGSLIIFGKKSAAVPYPDGSHRLLYAMESPESWFEDFGTGRLVRGRARVKLDRNFSKVVRLAEYHVFVSPEGDSKGLYISKKTKNEFEVREQQGGVGNLRFSYRLVARRKDVNVKRFERATLPPRPEIPKLPVSGARRRSRKRNSSVRTSKKTPRSQS